VAGKEVPQVRLLEDDTAPGNPDPLTTAYRIEGPRKPVGVARKNKASRQKDSPRIQNRREGDNHRMNIKILWTDEK